MPEVCGIDKLLSAGPGKRFSKFRLFGTSQFGFSNFGEEDIYFYFSQYGTAIFGADLFGDAICLSGVYRRDNVTGLVRYYRQEFRIPKNPRTEDQQNQRGKMADGVLSWQGLTPEEKKEYNKRAIGKHMSGYNLFLKEYLLTH